MSCLHSFKMDFCFFFSHITSEQVSCWPGSSAALVLDGHDLKLLSVKVEGKLLKVSIQYFSFRKIFVSLGSLYRLFSKTSNSVD